MYAPFEYMLPRYPTYIFNEPETLEECMPIARHLVATKGHWSTLGGTFSEGDTLLIVAPQYQDEMVLEAITTALREAGAAEVLRITPQEMGVPVKGTPGGIDTGEADAHEGWKEAAGVKGGQWVGDRIELIKFKEYLEEHPEIDGAYYGTGGRGHIRRWLGEHQDRFKTFWQLRNKEEFIWRFNNFPYTIWTMVEEWMAKLMGMASDARITDPQGTDLRFSIPGAVSPLWEKNILRPNHLMAYPPMAFRVWPGLTDLDEYLKYSIPVWETTEGTVAATAGHGGFYPAVKLHFEKGIVREIEGEGKAADAWRKNQEKWGDVQYPGFPEPSYLYHVDIAVATNPKAFRSRYIWKQNVFGTDRMRGGVIHMGFGLEHPDPRFGDFVHDEKVPGKHGSHMHIYFPTYALRMRNTGKWIKIIDRGWITLYDDPQIKRLASTIGDPCSVLSYDYVPPLPGINMAGDYEDYAENPASWAERELNLEFEIGKI